LISYLFLSIAYHPISSVVELDRASVYRYPGNYARYLELKAERIAAEDAEAQRARTKLRRESEWMAKQPR
jgi:ATP-binding cassette subfamily F protein uup